MPFALLEQYLAKLARLPQPVGGVWLDPDGRAQGRYFNSTLTSAFQPVRAVESSAIVGYEGFLRSYSDNDQGLSLWKLLDHAANDDESIELDRLCRLLHAINFFRQSGEAEHDLFLSVHARLLAAVESNHGAAFARILGALGLPKERFVLQLPAVTEQQRWLLSYVSDNYRRNGFRFAVNAASAQEGLGLLDRVRPDVLKVDAREVPDHATVAELVERCGEQGVQVIFKRVESGATFATLADATASTGVAVFGQGYLWDQPRAGLHRQNPAADVRRSGSVATT
jgi:EAL domain-containing protein (putative c-di-GMP-specific phosphodiesterase class I)